MDSVVASAAKSKSSSMLVAGVVSSNSSKIGSFVVCKKSKRSKGSGLV